MAKKKKFTSKEVLALKFYCADLDKNLTIRGYLMLLLSTLWEEQEGFSGKRPFGNSGWEYDLYKPLVEHGVVDGSICEDGYIQTFDEAAAYKVITACIKQLGKVE